MSEHHATVYIGTSLAKSRVPEAYRTASADVTHHIVDRLSIGDVRELSFAAHQRPVASPYRVLIIVANVLPTETQNALLKLFEEPPAATKLCLVIPNAGLLLPTLRSRVTIEVADEVLDSELPAPFTAFLQCSYAERLAAIATYTKAKEVETMRAIAQGALQYVAATPSQNPERAQVALRVAAQIDGPGAAKKMLLEWLALTLPVGSEV